MIIPETGTYHFRESNNGDGNKQSVFDPDHAVHQGFTVWPLPGFIPDKMQRLYGNIHMVTTPL